MSEEINFRAKCRNGHDVGIFFIRKNSSGKAIVYDIKEGQKPFYLVDGKSPIGVCKCEICGAPLYYEGDGAMSYIDCYPEDEERLEEAGVGTNRTWEAFVSEVKAWRSKNK